MSIVFFSIIEQRVKPLNNESQTDVARAFQWLDEFFFIPTDHGSPDEAFDWIFMMRDEDWRLLEQAWASRPPAWRESCAYILGQGPVPESLPLLRKALFDDNLEVATQAACAFACQRLDHGELVELDDETIIRLRELVAPFEGRNMEEVVEVLQSL